MLRLPRQVHIRGFEYTSKSMRAQEVPAHEIRATDESRAGYEEGRSGRQKDRKEEAERCRCRQRASEEGQGPVKTADVAHPAQEAVEEGRKAPLTLQGRRLRDTRSEGERQHVWITPRHSQELRPEHVEVNITHREE